MSEIEKAIKLIIDRVRGMLPTFPSFLFSRTQFKKCNCGQSGNLIFLSIVLLKTSMISIYFERVFICCKTKEHITLNQGKH